MGFRIPIVALLALVLLEGAAFGAAGDLDPSFGTGGIALSGPVPQSTVETLVQPDGKIVRVDIENQGDINSNYNLTVRRFNADGSPDGTYGQGGRAIADFGGTDQATGAALQPDGKLVVVGRTTAHPVVAAATIVARFDSSGRLDPSFAPDGGDGDGKTILTNSRNDKVEAVVIQPAGGIALVGARETTVIGEPVSTDQIWVRPLSEDGSPGAVTYDYAALDEIDLATSGTLTSDGNMLAAGTTHVGATSTTKLAIVRWTPDGKLDKTLAGTGKLSVPAFVGPVDVMALPDGRFVVAGMAVGAEQKPALMRFNRDGSPDPSFGENGVARLDVPGNGFPLAAARQNDGKILLAGGSTAELGVTVGRFSTEGRLDPGYANSGVARPLSGQIAGVYDAALAPDGKFVMAGAALSGGLTAMLARLLADPPPVGDGGPSGGGDAGGGGSAVDAESPALAALKVARKIAGKRPRIKFTLSEPARVRLALKRRGDPAVRFAVRGVAGANSVRAPRRLKRGRYRLVAIATDAADNISAPARIRFRVR